MPFYRIGMVTDMVERDDLVLIGLLLLIAGSIVYGYTQGMFADGNPAMNSETGQYCQKVAASIESNATFAGPDTTCECIPPGAFDESRYSTAEKVENVTELFLVRCESPQLRQPLIFPVRRVVAELPNGTDLNESVENGTTVLNETYR